MTPARKASSNQPQSRIAEVKPVKAPEIVSSPPARPSTKTASTASGAVSATVQRWPRCETAQRIAPVENHQRNRA